MIKNGPKKSNQVNSSEKIPVLDKPINRLEKNRNKNLFCYHEKKKK